LGSDEEDEEEEVAPAATQNHHTHRSQLRWLLLLLPLFLLGWLASLPAFCRRRGIEVFLNKLSQQSVGRAVRATVAENASRKQKFMVWLPLENFQSAVAT